MELQNNSVAVIEKGTGSKPDDNADDRNNAESFTVYPARWFMLFVVSFLNLSNALMWLTFAAAADTTVIYYGISSLQLNMLSMVFMIASVPCGFVATWVLDTFGLRAGLLISAWLNGVGGLLRNISTMSFVPRHQGYAVVLTGQILTACAQPFVMFAPTKVAAVWFPENRRATANMIGSMMKVMGNMVAFIIVPWIVEEPSDIPTNLWVISAPAFFITIVTTLGVQRSRPPTPPSASACKKSEPFLKGLKQIAGNRTYWILNLTFGAGVGLFSTLSALLAQILCPRGYSDEFAGLCGALIVAVGVVFSAVGGIYVDRTKRFDEVNKLAYGFCALAGIAFTQVSRLRDQHAGIAVTTALIGGFGLLLYPISMELAVEITYPVAAATSSGMCVVTGQILGIVCFFAMQFLARPMPIGEAHLGTACAETSVDGTAEFIPQDFTYSNMYIFNVVSTAGFVALVLFFKPTYRRLKMEQRARATKKALLNNTVPVQDKVSTKPECRGSSGFEFSPSKYSTNKVNGSVHSCDTRENVNLDENSENSVTMSRKQDDLPVEPLNEQTEENVLSNDGAHKDHCHHNPTFIHDTESKEYACTCTGLKPGQTRTYREQPHKHALDVNNETLDYIQNSNTCQVCDKTSPEPRSSTLPSNDNPHYADIDECTHM